MNGVHKTRTKSIWETRIIQTLGLTFWRKNQFKVDLSTLVSLIIMQDGIKVQDGKISKINKHAGWNKGVQAGFFQKNNKLCSTFIRETRVRDWHIALTTIRAHS